MFKLDPTYIGLAAAIISSLSFVPQAIKVIKTRETKAISLVSYSAFAFGIFLWLIYGLMLSDIPLILSNVITLTFVLIILGLKIKHG